jgi:hypothetical protein
MTQCPDHPNTLGASAGQCHACDRETDPADSTPATRPRPQPRTRPRPRTSEG